ncbi:hypothetical protein OH807_06125 [Kitasatospora sp. NBC_01560]|uniref:hypothetical protein n=1 Tax=Kitasatospora sp. NBC_01560 TaxID=2975965 RepID=UPI00386E822B
MLVEGAAAVSQFGMVGASWILGGTIVLLTPLALVGSRGWSRIGADGITICWGLGRGRTYPWHAIRWIDKRKTQSQDGSAYAVRMFLEGGRRRSLPGLYHSALHPADDFDEQFQRVVNWWELSTDPAGRVQPQKQFRDRLTPVVIGAVVVIVVAAVVALVILPPH